MYLCNESIGPLEPSLDPLGRFIGELDGALEQVDGELLVFLRRHPNSEVVVYILCCCDLKINKTIL